MCFLIIEKEYSVELSLILKLRQHLNEQRRNCPRQRKHESKGMVVGTRNQGQTTPEARRQQLELLQSGTATDRHSVVQRGGSAKT